MALFLKRFFSVKCMVYILSVHIIPVYNYNTTSGIKIGMPKYNQYTNKNRGASTKNWAP